MSAGSAATAVAAARARFLTSATARWLLAGLVLLALLPSALWLVGGTLIERQRALTEAQAMAMTLDWRLPDAQRDVLAQAEAVLGIGAPDLATQRREVTDASGVLLAARGDVRAALWPSLVIEVPLARPRDAAKVIIYRSLRPLATTGALLLLACTALAAVLWALALRSSVGAVRSAEGRLRAVATRDALTGLLNRDGLRQRLERALAVRRNGARKIGLLLVDVDRFRLVNDTLGQPAGDRLLRGVAERLRAVTRRDAALARLGGDQFAIAIDSAGSEQALIVLARNLLRACEPPLAAGDRQASTTVSIGIALAGDDVASADALLKNADAAMRAAKSRGGARHCLFDASMAVDAQRLLETEARLRRALQAQEFFLAYQPIALADGSRVAAVEALLRWSDPQRGVVSPGEFIPVLERTGLIVQVGAWVLREACTSARSWITDGAGDVVLSVNVSPLQFAEPDFVAMTLRTLAASGFPPQQLQLELTEGLLVEPTHDTLRKMDQLVDAGVRLAVDDFGIGYSSLAYLKRFRLHTLKIDRLFVRDVATQASDAAIVRAIVELAHGLALHVTAEGVETEAQWQALRGLGCDSMQGFLFARPIAFDDVRAMLRGQAGADPALSTWSTTMTALLDPITGR